MKCTRLLLSGARPPTLPHDRELWRMAGRSMHRHPNRGGRLRPIHGGRAPARSATRRLMRAQRRGGWSLLRLLSISSSLAPPALAGRLLLAPPLPPLLHLNRAAAGRSGSACHARGHAVDPLLHSHPLCTQLILNVVLLQRRPPPRAARSGTRRGGGRGGVLGVGTPHGSTSRVPRSACGQRRRRPVRVALGGRTGGSRAWGGGALIVW